MAEFSQNSDTPHMLNARIVDAGGSQAIIVSLQRNGSDTQAWIRFAEGVQVLVPVSLLTPEANGVYRLPFTFIPGGRNGPARMTFPVMEEELHVTKREVDTGRGVRIHKTVTEREQVLDQPLRRDELLVERVPVGRVISDADVPQVRHEDDTMVVPVLEEVLVVQKQLLLKEEVRITRRQHQVQAPHSVRLRSERIDVERFDEG